MSVARLPAEPPGRFRWGRAVGAIARKELVEVVRDRRTVIAALALPILVMPLVVLALPALARVQDERLRERPARIAAQGGGAGGLLAMGFDERAFVLVSVGDPRRALLRGDVDAVLVDRGTSASGPRLVTVLFDATRPASRAAVQKVSEVAARLALRDLRAAAASRGLDPERIISLAVEPQNLASPQRMGAALLGTALPFFLSVWLLLGGQYAALDVGVGERERGSLDALLVSPPPRSAIVAGKFLSVLAPAGLALVAMLASGLAAVRVGAAWLSDAPVVVSLSVSAAAWLLAVGLALGCLLSAIQLTLSLGARTLKQAQQAFTGLYLAVAVPVMFIPFAEEWAGRPWASLVPIVNAAVGFKAALAGDPRPATLVVTITSLVGLSMGVLAWAVAILEQQRQPNR